MELWKIYCEHVSSVNKGGGKNTRTRLDTLLLNKVIELLAKTTHSFYEK